MNILSGIGRWLLAVVVMFCLTAWIGLSVLNATLLNRQTVFGWLQTSGVYQNFFSTLTLKTDDQSVVNQETLQAATKNVFTPDYLKTQTENALGAIYDWAEGKKPTISFSIPVNEKQEAFSQELSRELAAQFASLPQCPSRTAPQTSQPTCVPQGISAADYAAQFSKLDNNQGNFLSGPLTQTALSDANALPPAWVPDVVAMTKWAVFVLPAVALLAAAGFILLSASKLQGLMAIGKRVCFYSLLLTLGGAVLFFFGGNISLVEAGSSDPQTAIVSTVIQPLVRQILPSVGVALTIYAGAVALVGLAAWLVGHILRRRQEQPLHTEHKPKIENTTPTEPTPPTPAPTDQPPAKPTV